jgi:AhpD family alkylhydroperoxidase
MMNRQEVYRDVERTFGMVPDWIKGMPDEGIGELWGLLRKTEVDESKIPAKYRDLMGLAVAAALRCRYCTFFHTEAAKLGGATEDELKEALLISSVVNLFSTYLNGSQYDLDHFKTETSKMIEHVREAMAVPAGR